MIRKVTKRTCDVFKTEKGTQRYQVLIMRVDDQGKLFDAEDPPVMSESIDLGPKGYGRLRAAIYRTLKRDPPVEPTVPTEPAPAPSVTVADDDGDPGVVPAYQMTAEQQALADEVVKDARAELDQSPTGGDAQAAP